MGWKGSVTVAFVILENGTVEAVRVIKRLWLRSP